MEDVSSREQIVASSQHSVYIQLVFEFQKLHRVSVFTL